MAVEIVTGYEDGKVHISPDDVGHGNAGIIGVDKYVLPVENKFALVGIDGRNVTIGTGDAMFNGRHVRSDENATFEITATDTSAYTRHDLICLRYTRSNITNFEKVEFFVVKGVASTTNPADPSIPNPNSTILNNDIEVYMPLHRVVITGGTISKVEPVYVVSPALSNTLHSDDGTNVKVNDTVLGTIDNLSYVMLKPDTNWIVGYDGQYGKVSYCRKSNIVHVLMIPNGKRAPVTSSEVTLFYMPEDFRAHQFYIADASMVGALKKQVVYLVINEEGRCYFYNEGPNTGYASCNFCYPL